MKFYLWGFAIILLGFTAEGEIWNYYLHHQKLSHLEFVAQEAAAGSAQFYDTVAYSEGEFVFNQTEGDKAAEYIIKKNLGLNDSFVPKESSFWNETVSYDIEYFDSSTGYPGAYQKGNSSYYISDPTVVVTIYVGKNGEDFLSTQAHQFEER